MREIKKPTFTIGEISMKKIYNPFKKKKIIKYAKNYGCNLDGDIVPYKGSLYYVVIVKNLVYLNFHCFY